MKERTCACGEKETQTIDKLRESEGLEYTLNYNGTSYSVTGIGTCNDTDLVIPSEYNGLPVTSIGDYAFWDCTSLTSVVIPDSVTSIGKQAFDDCTSLTSIEIPDSVTSIGSHAFDGCTSLVDVYYMGDIEDWLTIDFENPYSNPLCNGANWYLNNEPVTEIVISNGITSIGDYSFIGCTSLESIEIPDSVTSIGVAAFYGCTSLESIEIPDSVTSIGAAAFYGCTSLESIEIPDSVTSIGASAFQNCTSLTSIEIPDSVTSIGYEAFRYCTSLVNVYYTGDITTWINITFSFYSNPMANGANLYFNNELVTEVEIPNTITSIGNYAFSGCISLESIEIPDSVTIIGGHAFSDCTSLESIEIPDSVTSIGAYAFEDCTSLVDVYYMGDIEDWLGITFEFWYSNPVTYGANLYFNNRIVTKIKIPESVTSIGNYSFYGCTSLTSIEIPDSVTSIGEDAFYGCTSLIEVINKSSLNIVAGLYNDGRVGYYAKYIKTGEAESAIKIVGDYIFYDDGTDIYLVRYIGSDTAITLPEYDGGKEYEIWNYAFKDCDSLTSITISNSVTSIGNYAFDDCTFLISIDIGASVTSIGDRAFDDCTALASVVIGDSVTSIGDWAFYDCTSLIEVINKSSLNIVAGLSNDGHVGYYAKYIKTGEAESAIKIVGDYIFYDDGTEIYLVKYLGSNNEITLPEYDGGKEYGIWNYAFHGYDKITSVTISNSVTSIGEGSFWGCTSLTSIEISDSVTSIGEGSFWGCTSLTSIEIPDSVTWIDYSAFRDCTSLTSIEIPDTVAFIGQFAFANCTSLTIYCEAESQPIEWHSRWNDSNRPVVWGYKGE